MKQLNYKVFPSEDKTISVEDDLYGGAHHYSAKKSLGFEDNKALYIEEEVSLPFVFKDGDVTAPGLQSEQLAYILLDRVVKLNARFPSEHNVKMMAGLDMFLDACQERVKERISRGVMGKLKK